MLEFSTVDTAAAAADSGTVLMISLDDSQPAAGRITALIYHSQSQN